MRTRRTSLTPQMATASIKRTAEKLKWRPSKAKAGDLEAKASLSDESDDDLFDEHYDKDTRVPAAPRKRKSASLRTVRDAKETRGGCAAKFLERGSRKRAPSKLLMESERTEKTFDAIGLSDEEDAGAEPILDRDAYRLKFYPKRLKRVSKKVANEPESVAASFPSASSDHFCQIFSHTQTNNNYNQPQCPL